MNDERFHDECGVFGVLGHPEAANLTYLGLYALQHRGQEAAGIVSYDETTTYSNRARGLVSDIFSQEVLDGLKGDRAIGHVRYSTAGGGAIRNIQPFVVDYLRGTLSIAHNGNLTNAEAIRRELEETGSIFQSTMDTEVIVHLLARDAGTQSIDDRIVHALGRIQGAYSLVLMSNNRMFGVRDPHGFRPLSLGKLGDAWVLSSETCAFDLIDAEFVRDVEPGEMVIITRDGVTSRRFAPQIPRRLCIFEYVYFARPDSTIDGVNVYMARKEVGRRLALEHPIEADLVVPVPDSGVAAAIGYAEQAGLPLDLGLIRNHYVGRTFIEPKQSIRNFGVKIKLNANPELLKGKRVILVDDSIVRGTTSKKIVRMVRDAGAAEVHMRISSPPTTNPCFYGIDTPNREELLAANNTLEQMQAFIEADSLGYISVNGLHEAVGQDSAGYCDACFTGDYPVGVITPIDNEKRHQRMLFEYR
ncbi:MAG: amidophosphoribosyltransferase [Proteobacteria bacterium CG1_02_64_396]|nr:MAG: amidophosphoribosyltransferase [Proteobacteria bacterium CG1_02_64_396]